jgi:2-octaprenylphenol hydroxylase
VSEKAYSRFDVAVGGGGCTGNTFACAAAMAGLRVAVIERREPEMPWPEDSVDLRVYAITRASQCIFGSLGVWDEIVDGGVSPFREMQVWDAGGKGAIHFDCADIGQPVLGHIIEQRVIQAGCW